MNVSRRLNTCKSNGNRKELAPSLTSGKRVSNTCLTCPKAWDNWGNPANPGCGLKVEILKD